MHALTDAFSNYLQQFLCLPVPAGPSPSVSLPEWTPSKFGSLWASAVLMLFDVCLFRTTKCSAIWQVLLFQIIPKEYLCYIGTT